MHLLPESASQGTGVSETSRRAIYDSLKSEIARYPYFLRRETLLTAYDNNPR